MRVRQQISAQGDTVACCCEARHAGVTAWHRYRSQRCPFQRHQRRASPRSPAHLQRHSRALQQDAPRVASTISPAFHSSSGKARSPRLHAVSSLQTSVCSFVKKDRHRHKVQPSSSACLYMSAFRLLQRVSIAFSCSSSFFSHALQPSTFHLYRGKWSSFSFFMAFCSSFLLEITRRHLQAFSSDSHLRRGAAERHAAIALTPCHMPYSFTMRAPPAPRRR